MCVCVCVYGGGAMCIACKVLLCVYIHTVYSICIVDRTLNSNLHKNQHSTNFQEANYCIGGGMSVFCLSQYLNYVTPKCIIQQYVCCNYVSLLCNCCSLFIFTKELSVHLDSPTCFNTSTTKFLKIDITLSHTFQNTSV